MTYRLDLSGQTFGRLLVLRADGHIYGEKIAWLCLCECGREVRLPATALRSGNTTSCGCRKTEEGNRSHDLTGRVFSRLTVQAFDGTAGGQGARWRCLCSCGNEVTVRGQHLLSGMTKSCGCQRSDSAKLTNRRHGMAGTAEYRCWVNMKQRCLNPANTAWANYGGRGITICQRWADSFEAFLDDVGRQPTAEHSLDRIDNNGNYEPGNIRWATRSAQMKNRRPVQRVTRGEHEAVLAENERLRALLAQ